VPESNSGRASRSRLVAAIVPLKRASPFHLAGDGGSFRKPALAETRSSPSITALPNLMEPITRPVSEPAVSAAYPSRA